MQRGYNHFETTVSKSLHGYRLDIALTELKELGLSRRKVRRIIDLGGAYVNKKRVRIASRSLSAGDKVELHYDASSLVVRQTLTELKDEQIILEHDDYFVLNKPTGLASQATKDQAVDHVVTALARYLAARNGTSEKIELGGLFLAHRLDRETSGVLIIARTTDFLTHITEEFRQRRVKKKYLALAYGVPSGVELDNGEFTIANHLSKITSQCQFVRVVKAGGASAETRFKVLRTNKARGFTLLECYPTTGRTHQIRVHLECAGMSLVGDKVYSKFAAGHPLNDVEAGWALKGHTLHSQETQFNSKGLETVTVEAAQLPSGMHSLIRSLTPSS
jgi:RluA family pseudouridine synthase